MNKYWLSEKQKGEKRGLGNLMQSKTVSLMFHATSFRDSMRFTLST